MDKIDWEHKIVELHGVSTETIRTVIMSHGAAGWECVSVVQVNADTLVVFKRPKGAQSGDTTARNTE